jgi:ATP-binding cassette, subfamily C, bacterial CydD
MSAGGSRERRSAARPDGRAEARQPGRGRAGWQRVVDPRLLRQARAARGYLAVTTGLGLAGAVLILAQAGLLAHALATAAHGTGTAALAGTLLALLAVVIGRAVVTGGGEAAALRAAAAVKSQLRRALAGHVLRLGRGWLAGQPPGEMAALATRGLDGLDPYFARYLPQLMLAVLVPAAVLARVLAADWISAVIIAVTLPLIPLFTVLVGWHTKASTRRQWRLLATLAGHFLDVVEGLPTLKVFGRARPQEKVIAEVTGRYRAMTMATLRVAFLSALVLELSAAVATALVAVEVGLRLLYGHLDYQTALLVLLLTPEAYLPLRAVASQFHASMEGAAAAGRVLDILDTGPASPPAPGPGQPAHAARVDARAEEIRLDDVTVAFPGRSQPALAGIRLVIRPGERVVLTGPSGAGKSTLFALLLGFAQPTAGTVRLGAASLAGADLDHWRAQIGWVPQRPYLFAGTAAENIALGRPDASPAEIQHAAELAGAAEFIEAWPAGYGTALGEHALRLSSGERQRIALARAFLRDAPLLLLDEPAAHLDPAGAHRLGQVIDALPADRTIIVITHGPWLGTRTGREIRLDGGRLVPALGPAPPDRRAGQSPSGRQHGSGGQDPQAVAR